MNLNCLIWVWKVGSLILSNTGWPMKSAKSIFLSLSRFDLNLLAITLHYWLKLSLSRSLNFRASASSFSLMTSHSFLYELITWCLYWRFLPPSYLCSTYWVRISSYNCKQELKLFCKNVGERSWTGQRGGGRKLDKGNSELFLARYGFACLIFSMILTISFCL